MFAVNDYGHTLSEVCVHLKSCRYVNLCRDNWHGPYATLELAENEARKIGRLKLRYCGECKPQRRQ